MLYWTNNVQTSTPIVTYGEITVFLNIRDVYENHYVYNFIQKYLSHKSH